MKLLHTSLAFAFAALTTFAASGHAVADDHHEGEELTIHNNTGGEVLVFLFQDDHPHLDEDGGTQWGDIKNNEEKTAHVPSCHFAILLVDHEDVWHQEFDDCHSTDLVFTSAKTDKHHTKHAHKKH